MFCALCLSTLGTRIPSTFVEIPVAFLAVISNVESGEVLLIPICAEMSEELKIVSIMENGILFMGIFFR